MAAKPWLGRTRARLARAERAYWAECEKLAKDLRADVVAACDKHGLRFRSGMGTYLLYTRNAGFSLYPNDMRGLPLASLFTKLEAQTMSGHPIGSLVPSYEDSY